MFLQLTDKKTNESVLFPLNNICSITTFGEGSLIRTSDGHSTHVTAKLEDITKTLEHREAIKNLASMIHPNTVSSNVRNSY